jgi:hypothetical protein
MKRSRSELRVIQHLSAIPPCNPAAAPPKPAIIIGSCHKRSRSNLANSISVALWLGAPSLIGLLLTFNLD